MYFAKPNKTDKTIQTKQINENELMNDTSLVNKFCNFWRTVVFKLFLQLLVLTLIVSMVLDHLSLNMFKALGTRMGNIHFIWGAYWFEGQENQGIFILLKGTLKKIKREECNL